MLIFVVDHEPTMLRDSGRAIRTAAPEAVLMCFELAADALDAARAKSERELALSRLARLELAHNTVLQRLISSVEGAEGEPTRYFIPEEQKYRAEGRFEQKGNGILSLVLTAALAFGLALLLFLIIPLALSIV